MIFQFLVYSIERSVNAPAPIVRGAYRGASAICAAAVCAAPRRNAAARHPSRHGARGRDGGCRDPARGASAAAADLAARPAARRPRPRRRAAGDRGQQHHRPLHGPGVHAGGGHRAARGGRRGAGGAARAGGALRRDARRRRHHAGARRRGGRPGADPERARPRRPAARRRLPGEPAPPRPEPGDARRRAGAVPGGEAMDRLAPRRGLASRGPAAGRRLPPRRREVRRSASSRRGPTRIPAAPAAPIPDTSRSRRRCRSSPSARPTTTCWSRPTRARSSPPGCPITPGTRARWRARRASRRPPGIRRMEAWGGTQLQTRFEKQSNRPMRPEDYNAWMALRAVGEAATRTQLDRPRRAARLYPRPGLRARRLQGPAGDLPRLGRPAAPADPARRRQRRGLGLAAGRVRPPVLAARHPRHRPPRDRMPPRERKEPPCATLLAAALVAPRRAGGRLHGLRQQRARQLDLDPRQRDAGGGRRRSRSASARAASTSAPTASGSTSSPPTTTTCR